MKNKRSFYRANLASLIAIATAVLVIVLVDNKGGWILQLGIGLIAIGGFSVLVGLAIELIHSHRKI